MNSNTSQQQDLERAAQMVERFVRRFQPSYRLLAYHASLPLVLTPELVHFLRVQFLRSEDVPWVAEVDLLLSDLCRQVGYELYAMDTAVRAYLLEEMKRELGEQRMQDVAKLLINYVKYLHQTNPYISSQELQAQQWAAMVFLEEPRQRAVREIAEAFELGLVNKAELARLARITQELAPQLRMYQDLVDYAQLVSKLLTDATKVKREDVRRSFEVLPGVERHISNELLPDNLRIKIPESASPFRPGVVITNPRDFFDREELLQRIFEILARGGNVSLVGERRIGKTSTLYQICNQGKERFHAMGIPERTFAYLDLQLVRNEEEFYQALCDVLEIPFSHGYQLTRALQNRRYVLCVDEVERMTEPALTQEILSQLRGLASGENSPLKLIFASRYFLNILFVPSAINTSPLSNIFTELKVEPFSLEVTKAFLTHYLAGTGVEFNEQQINQLFDETRGHPGGLQEVADKLYQQVISSYPDLINTTPELKVFEFEVVTVNKQGEIIQREQRQARYFTEDLGNGIILDMVAIPGGTFTMGAPKTEKGSRDSEHPQHQVTVLAFFMSKYPVTQAQWQAVAALPRVRRDLDPDPSRFKGDNRPVESVSWFDATEFCERLSNYTKREYRLASEAEWEYACRAGTTTPFYFGETMTTELVNYNGEYTYGNAPEGEYREETTPVGSFPPNAFGLYDMHGNVWECCADTWHSNYEGAPKDGSAWVEASDNYNKNRVLRGGSWRNEPGCCRSAYRSSFKPDYDNFNYSFRVVWGVVRTK